MIIAEVQPIFDILVEISPDNQETWNHIQSRASTFINSLSYNHLAKAKRPEEGISLTINGETREFRPLSQATPEGKIHLYLGHSDLGGRVLLLVLKPSEDEDPLKKFDFELCTIAVVNNPNENRPRT